jgi:hypothetical protein
MPRRGSVVGIQSRSPRAAEQNHSAKPSFTIVRKPHSIGSRSTRKADVSECRIQDPENEEEEEETFTYHVRKNDGDGDRRENSRRKHRQEENNTTLNETYPLSSQDNDGVLSTPHKSSEERHTSQAEIQRSTMEASVSVPEGDTCLVSEAGAETQSQSPRNLPAVSSKARVSTLQDSFALSLGHSTSLGNSNESKSGKQKVEDLSSAESIDESDDASEECEVNVGGALRSAMNVVKNLLLQELLDYTLPDATDAVHESGGSASGGTGGSTSSSLASTSSGNSKTPKGSKRLRENGRDPGDGDGDGDNSDDEDRPKKKGGRRLPEHFPQRRLKCPFYQRQPEKYTKAACRGTGFADMAKLKDHIKRVHTQPLRCPRCWLEMDSDEAYHEHLQHEIICQKEPEPQDDRIRPQLLKRLDFKKAPYANASNVEEKWKMLFSILFPSDDIIPSPCEFSLATFHSSRVLTGLDEQQGMSPQLERALCEALEEELTRELALVIEPIMTKIKRCIPAILESCRQKLASTTSSSDDEAVFTPSATSSGTGSSKSGCGSSTKAAKQWVDSTTSRCSRLAFEAPPDTETLVDGSQKECLPPPVPCAGDSSTIDPKHIASQHAVEHGTFPIDAPYPYHGSQASSIENSSNHAFDPLYAHIYSGSLPSRSNLAGSKPTASADQGVIGAQFGFGACSLLSDSDWPLAGNGWDHVDATHGGFNAKQQDLHPSQQLLAPGEWDNLMNELGM